MYFRHPLFFSPYIYIWIYIPHIYIYDVWNTLIETDKYAKFNWILVGSAGTPKPCHSAPEASVPGVAFRPLLRFKGPSRRYSWIQSRKQISFNNLLCILWSHLWRRVVTGTTGSIGWQCMFCCNTINEICSYCMYSVTGILFFDS